MSLFGGVTKDHTASQSQDKGRRNLRVGAAKVAQEIRDTGHNAGNGLKAEDMSKHVGAKNLNRMAEGMNPVVVTKPTSRWCGVCKLVKGDPWQPFGHECNA